MANSVRMNPTERIQYIDKISEKIVKAIEEKGPLNFQALYYFTQKDFNEYILDKDFRYALNVAEETYKILYSKKQELYVLAINPDAKPTLPSPENFTEAYYNLLERYRTVLASSDYRNAPEEWLEKIFPPIT